MSEPVTERGAAEADYEASADAAVHDDVAELTELLQRLQADFDNYRKRTRAEKDVAKREATISLVKSLLPALDALDSLARASDVEGAVLTQRLFTEALAGAGVFRIEDTDVDFDPSLHEPVGPGANNVVINVWRPGYQLGGTLLRPASVELS